MKLDTQEIVRESMDIINGNIKKGRVPEKWDGKTAERVVNIFKETLK